MSLQEEVQSLQLLHSKDALSYNTMLHLIGHAYLRHANTSDYAKAGHAGELGFERMRFHLAEDKAMERGAPVCHRCSTVQITARDFMDTICQIPATHDDRYAYAMSAAQQRMVAFLSDYRLTLNIYVAPSGLKIIAYNTEMSLEEVETMRVRLTDLFPEANILASNREIHLKALQPFSSQPE